MKFPAVTSLLLIGTTVCAGVSHSDTTMPSDVPERIFLRPGECTSALAPDRSLRWICADSITAIDTDLGMLKGQLSSIRQLHEQLYAEKVWLEDLLISAQNDNRMLVENNKILVDKLAAVSREESQRVSMLTSQIEHLMERVTMLSNESQTQLSGDSDLDGVVDLADLCANTNQGLLVDETGCAHDQEIAPKGINFAWNSTRLAASSRVVLNAVANQLKRHPKLTFEVAGHTDSSGNADANLLISAKRAGAVREYLLAQGIPSESLTVKGYGKEKPIADNSTPAGRAANRRVTFYRPADTDALACAQHRATETSPGIQGCRVSTQ